VVHSSLSLFPKFRQKSHQFAVIGLGRFGRAVCKTLHQSGYEVLGTDVDGERVRELMTSQIASHILQLDATNPTALKAAGIFEFDTVIIAIGNYLQESIVTTLNVKEGGVGYVVAKASTEIHGKLLQRVGADRVVFPENDAGCALAQSLTKPSILERFDLDPEHSIVEVVVPEDFDGRTISELQLRSRYGLNVLAVGNEGRFEINPDPAQHLVQGMMMVVIGANRDIDRLPI
jgi:trk system potassium uptake protein TrkA